MALTKVSTDGVKDDAVTTDKLANAINTERTANTAKVSTTINNNADNRVITGSGTASTLNGESNVVIDSSGRLGVGTTSPARKFVVTEATANRIANFTTGGSSGAFIAFLDSNTTDDSKCRIGSIGGNALGMRGDSHSFQDGAGNTKMRIDSSGDIGLGTSTPNLTGYTSPVTSIGKSGNPYAVLELQGTQTSDGAMGLITGYNTSGSSRIATINWNRDGANNSGSLSFETASSGTLGERFRIRSTGGVTFNGDTAAANALDDYEEGTFTPTQPTVGFNSASGHYTKIGRQVTVSVFCTLPTNGSGQAFVIDGMPFTSKSNSGTYIQGGYVMYTQYTSQALKVLIHDNSTRMQVYSGAGGDIALTNLDNHNFRIQLHYTVS